MSIETIQLQRRIVQLESIIRDKVLENQALKAYIREEFDRPSNNLLAAQAELKRQNKELKWIHSEIVKGFEKMKGFSHKPACPNCGKRKGVVIIERKFACGECNLEWALSSDLSYLEYLSQKVKALDNT